MSSPRTLYLSSSSSAAAADLILLLQIAVQFFLVRPSSALVHLNSEPFFFSFLDAPARFGVPVDGNGICGSLHVADPIYACSPLLYTGRGTAEKSRSFVLISRGECSFEEKVRNAQNGGYDAAIVYDDQDKTSLYSMIGDSMGIHIPAVFVSKMAGETLSKFAKGEEGECCIKSSMDETAGTVLVMSFVSLVVIISVLASFLFARNWRLLRNGVHSSPPCMKAQTVEGLPCVTYNSVDSSGKELDEACPICLEDHKAGEKLRVLPCRHGFHVACVDPWLTKWGTFCPVCKLEVSSGE